MRSGSAPIALASVLLASGGSAVEGPPAPDFERCETAVRDHPELKESFRCFFDVARARKDWAGAARRLEAHLALDPGNPKAKLTLAWIEWDRGGARAERLFGEAADGFAAERDRNGEVFSRLGFASYLLQRARVVEAEHEAEAALAAARSTDDPILLARVRISQTELAFARSDFGTALRFLREAEEIAVANDSTDILTLVLGDKGYAYWELGMDRLGLEAYARQAELYRLMGTRWGATFDEGRARYSMACLAERLFAAGEMEREEVLRFGRDAVDSALRSGNRMIEANARLFLSRQLEPKDAIPEIERARALARETADAKTVRLAERLLARRQIDADPGRSEEAFRAADRAILDARSAGDLEDVARGLLMRTEMRHRTGPRDRWLEDGRETLQAIERIRDLQPEGTIRARAFGPWAEAYRAFSGRLLEGLASSPDPRGDLDLAFATIERMRARVLLDEMDRAGSRPALDPADPDVRHRDEVLGSIVAIQKGLLDVSRPAAARESALRDLERLEAEEETLRDAIARRTPAFARLHPPAIAGLAEVQSRLSPDQALLSFVFASPDVGEAAPDDTGSWLVVVTPDRANAYRLPERRAIEDRVSVFLGLCRRRDGSEARAAARLYRDLLAEALAEAGRGVRKLVVVPDGVLHRLPLPALRESPGAAPLVSRYETAVVPSATLWLRWKEGEGAARQAAALALADPDVATVPADAALRAANPWLESLALGPLPHARREARALAREIGAGSRVWTGGDASESALKRTDLRGFGVLHLAAHAIVDDGHPERSAVLLCPGEPKEDGLLQLREIASLPLDGRVVILSTCKSASGDEVPGEGVIGLARGFFQAGAVAVMGTLWPVRDDEAEEFVKRFGREIGEGRSVAAAHASAARDAIGRGLPTAAWAGTVVLGDGDVAPAVGNRRRRWAAVTWTAVIAALAGLGVVGAIRRSGTRRYPGDGQVFSRGSGPSKSG